MVVSVIKAKHSEVLKNTEATISCEVTGLTKALDTVTWEKPNSGGTITDGTDDYAIDKGTYNAGSHSQTTVLTIPASENTVDTVYTCIIQSDEHGKSAERTDVKSNVFSEYAYNNCRVMFLRYFRFKRVGT